MLMAHHPLFYVYIKPKIMNLAVALTRATKILHQIGCILIWAYMLYMVIYQFSGNEDSSEVSFQKFTPENEAEVGYPTFSVCIRGVDGGIFYPLIQTDLYQELYKHPNCNKSGINHPWCETALFQKMLQGKEDISLNASTQNIDPITISVLPLMKRWRFSDDIGEWQHYTNKMMYLSYQDSFRTCYTKKYEPGTGRNITHDMYSIEADKIGLAIEIYVHQVGGLIAIMGKKYLFQITKSEVDEVYANFNSTLDLSYPTPKGLTVFYDFHVRMVKILRKRADAVTACNKNITNNDKIYKEALIMEVGCIPSYWKRFFVGKKFEYLPDCTKQTQFQQLAHMLPTMSENTNLRNGTKLYDQPCNEMKVCSILYKRNERHVNNKLWIGFYYDEDEYLEVVNKKAISTYDLWSQIGGVVGIFLGVSILQVIES